MTNTAALIQSSSFIVKATGALRQHSAEVSTPVGEALASADGAGTIRAAGGETLWIAPVEQGGRRDQPLEMRVQINDAGGSPLGQVRVARYKLGRSSSLSTRVVDTNDAEIARVEAVDGKAGHYTVTANGSPAGTMTIETVKTGFLKKARHHTVQLEASLPDAARQLLIVALIRHDALLGGVTAAAAR